MIKLWKIGEFDWFAAATAEQARAGYLKFFGMEPDEIELDDVEEMSAEDMNAYQFFDNPEDPDNSPKRTFKEELDRLVAAGTTFPCMFATSDG